MRLYSNNCKKLLSSRVSKILTRKPNSNTSILLLSNILKEQKLELADAMCNSNAVKFLNFGQWVCCSFRSICYDSLNHSPKPEVSLKVSLLHRDFSHFPTSTYGTKLCKASHSNVYIHILVICFGKNKKRNYILSDIMLKNS